MTKNLRLNDKVAIITGAADGIGRATAIMCAREGALLSLADINEKGLREVAELIQNEGGKAIFRIIDVADETAVKELIDETLSSYSRVDVLCNNAGIAGDMFSLEDQDGQIWRRVFEVNVMGVVYATKHIVQSMKERKSGSIVNVASIAGIRSGAGGNAYSASKAAVINFSQTAACELGSFNIRVNAVCPGLIETAMTRPIFEYARQAGKESRIGNRCELRRYAKPEEVASVILFLASDEASYITGQYIAVDGGITASLSDPGKKI